MQVRVLCSAVTCLRSASRTKTNQDLNNPEHLLLASHGTIKSMEIFNNKVLHSTDFVQDVVTRHAALQTQTEVLRMHHSSELYSVSVSLANASKKYEKRCERMGECDSGRNFSHESQLQTPQCS